MSVLFNRILGVVNGETPLSEYLSADLRNKWAISSSGFSGPSWNILRRALMKFDFGDIGYPSEYIEVEILDQLTLSDLEQIKHAGSKRIDLLLSELAKNSCEYLAKPRLEPKRPIDTLEEVSSDMGTRLLEKTILMDILLSENWREDFNKKFHLHFDSSIFEDDLVFRRLTIFESRVAGQSLAEIGKDFGISRERVRQILEKSFSTIADNSIFEGKSLQSILDERQNSETAKKAHEIAMNSKEINLKIRKALNDNSGLKYSELAVILETTEDLIKSSISPQASKFVLIEIVPHNFRPQFSEEFTLDAIRMAAAIRSPLSAPMYENLVERGLVKGPRAQMIAKRFGSWSNACRIAGVLHVQPVRSTYSKTWTEGEALLFIIRFLKNNDFGVGVLSYDEWRDLYAKEAPSSGHLRNIFGSWIACKNKALEYMRVNSISCNLL
jgi:hypothetical protein